ncbi:hypothetical protein L195_g046057 [Trifolium pratense]|uniref:Uncharacterized protein n=1 Tax=Trifolium pratense TaxID=57577 RepID=A0A2K3MGP8_TRIPR|nr:hypothetical protein L195_g046057 [Trifolium pratense]
MQRLKLTTLLLLSPSPPPPPLHCSHSSLKCFSSISSSSSVSPWSGLHSWRNSPLNENRKWGPLGPQHQPEPDLNHSPFGEASSLAEFGSIVLSTTDPLQKSHLSHVAYSLWRSRNLPLGQSDPPSRPARPEKPQLVCSRFRPPTVCFNS